LNASRRRERKKEISTYREEGGGQDIEEGTVGAYDRRDPRKSGECLSQLKSIVEIIGSDWSKVESRKK